MITVGMDYKIIPGKDQEFTSVFEKVLRIMVDMPGHSKTNLYRNVWSEHDYLVVSEWSDEHAFRSFIASDRFRGVANWGKDNVLAARPTHEVYGAADDGGGEDQAPPPGCPAHA
ncbi:MAG: antibiotic biosynthesis monooxygenase family protein [Planctomycetota bacterium]